MSSVRFICGTQDLHKNLEKKISTFGGTWHSDFSFLEEPPSLTLLHAVELPDVGGDTLWASLSAAYTALPPATRAICDDLRVVHRFDASLLASVERHHGPQVARRLVEVHAHVEQPLVTVDPANGRRCLYL